jgi:hypothetical protein
MIANLFEASDGSVSTFRGWIVNTPVIREQLRQQIERVPDELLQEIADFISFVLMRRQKVASYTDWEQNQWDALAIGQLFRETNDDIEYLLDDAKEVFHP